jgi:hypothetical protein
MTCALVLVAGAASFSERQPYLLLITRNTLISVGNHPDGTGLKTGLSLFWAAERVTRPSPSTTTDGPCLDDCGPWKGNESPPPDLKEEDPGQEREKCVN